MNIKSKVVTFILFFTLSLLGVFVAFTQWSMNKGMIEFINAKEAKALEPLIIHLSQEYKKRDSWYFIQNRGRKFEKLLRSNLSGSHLSLPPLPKRRPPPPHLLNNVDKPSSLRGTSESLPKRRYEPKVHYALVDANYQYLVGIYSADREYTYQAINVEKVVIGYLAVSKRTELVSGYELDFINQQRHYLWLGGAVLFIIAVIIAVIISRHFIQPIRVLTHGMAQLTQGHYDLTINNERSDELGQLARDFNELAMTLCRNDDARKRWLANISHELRTPVAILRGEIEAIIDGIRPLEKKYIQSLAQEIGHLQLLIDDLNTLTSADIGGMTYRKKILLLDEFIGHFDEKYNGFLSESGLVLELKYIESPSSVYADSTRLFQLFDNLIGNSVKYAETARVIRISLYHENKHAVVTVEDDGIGVADKHLPLLFEHLYKVDNARTRENGGSGLGLSICYHIVKAHHGEINAHRSELGGLKIKITLPLSE